MWIVIVVGVMMIVVNPTELFNLRWYRLPVHQQLHHRFIEWITIMSIDCLFFILFLTCSCLFGHALVWLRENNCNWGWLYWCLGIELYGWPNGGAFSRTVGFRFPPSSVTSRKRALQESWVSFRPSLLNLAGFRTYFPKIKPVQYVLTLLGRSQFFFFSTASKMRPRFRCGHEMRNVMAVRSWHVHGTCAALVFVFRKENGGMKKMQWIFIIKLES